MCAHLSLSSSGAITHSYKSVKTARSSTNSVTRYTTGCMRAGAAGGIQVSRDPWQTRHHSALAVGSRNNTKCNSRIPRKVRQTASLAGARTIAMEVDEELRQIIGAFNGGKKDDAITRLVAYVQAHPDSAVAPAILFEFYQAKGEMDKVRCRRCCEARLEGMLISLDRLAMLECRRWRSAWR